MSTAYLALKVKPLLVAALTVALLVLTKLWAVTLLMPFTKPVCKQESTLVASMKRSCQASSGSFKSALVELPRLLEWCFPLDPKLIQGDWNGAGAHTNDRELQTVGHQFVLDVTLKSGQDTTILWNSV
ncbi:hypothetical protein OPV22_032472 [Ensete ventricosum]|uniref:Endonuclease/exonuclease/phosphatase domain-containing protein n=1 Tax=Ensete ventricosum TaxID=4639 RepID=A0AAV8P2A0_ENSVE|nr:hypothetical protein OPV22_032472 [Ensete ventricosum]